MLLLAVAAFLFWAGGVSLLGWAVLAACFVVLLGLRSSLIHSGIIAGAAAWLGALVVLFLALGMTSASKDAGIAAPPPTPSGGMKVQNAVTGTSIDNTQKITNPTSVFRSNTEEICFSAEVMNVVQPTSMDIKLFYVATGDNIGGPTQQLLPAQGVSRVGFVFSKPAAGWPPGQYQATFYLNGQDAGSVNFSVQQYRRTGRSVAPQECVLHVVGDRVKSEA